MLDAQSSAQPEAAKGLLGSGFYFWVLVFVSEDIFGAFLAAAAAAAFFFNWENIFAEALPVWALFSCFVGSAAQTYRCRLTAARLLRCWVCVCGALQQHEVRPLQGP